MTENDAIAKFKRTSVLWESATNTEMVEAVKVAIQAIEEIQQYRAIGTIDEFKALKEKFENAKDDIRKLLSSEYGSSCQFCVHDENEDAMCCNIGGSGSWCCENARWKEH